MSSVRPDVSQSKLDRSATPLKPSHGFRLDIEGLRAVAVIAVILDHLFFWPRGGFVGVDIFFVISGFLITGLLLKEYERSGTISFTTFYKRRVRRILPAALLVLTVTTAASFLIFSVVRAQSTLWDGIWSALFVGNWNFALAGTDYFAADGPLSPFRHYWSLSVEEQFYLVWPWLMLLVIMLSRSGKKKSDARKRVVQQIGILISVIIVASFAWAFIESTTSPTVAYFSTFSRAWELGVGALLAVSAAWVGRMPAMLRPILAYVGLAGIVASFVVISGETVFPVPGALLPVLSTGLVIAAGIGSVSPWMLPLTNPVAAYIGRLSFSLYLWHFPVIVLLESIVPRSQPLYYAFAIALTIVLSVSSFHLVEDPIRRSSWLDGKSSPRRRSRSRSGSRGPAGSKSRNAVLVASAALGILVIGLATVALRGAPSDQSALSPNPASPDASSEDEGSSALEQRLSAVKTALSATEWPILSPSVDQFSNNGRDVLSPEWVTEGCLGADDARNEDARENTTNCVYGAQDAGADRTAVIFGDSLAISYAPMVRQALGEEWQVRVFTMARCPTSTVESNDVDGSSYEACTEFRAWALEELNRVKPRLIITSEALDNSFLTSGATGADANREWRAGALATLTGLRDASPDVLVLARPPVGESLIECQTPGSTPADCVSAISQSHTTHMALTESAVEEVGGSVQFVNTLGWFCALSKCPVFVGESPVRGDSAHLTARQSESLSPVMSEILVAALAD